MTNRHASKQHGATMHNEQRPKSKLRKRANKHRSVARKAKIIEERRATAKPTTAETATTTETAAKAIVTKPATKKPVKKVAKKD